MSESNSSPASAPEMVFAALREAILNGELPGGYQLRQDELADRYGTSRIPVREALRQLEAEGLIKYETGRGATVVQLSLGDVLEMLDIRIALECRALRLAVPNMTEGDFTSLGEILKQYGREKKAVKWGELNRTFHFALYSPCDRPRLLALIQNNFDNANRFIRLQVSLATGRDRPHEEHQAILAACLQGDAAHAAKLLEAHISYTQKAVSAAVRLQRSKSAASR